MRFKHNPNLSLVYIIILFGMIFSPMQVKAQTPSQFCKDTNKDINSNVLLEVTRTGRGMIWPNLITQVFFRLYEDGFVEYDVRTGQDIVRKRQKLGANDVSQLRTLIEKPDFIRADKKYNLIENIKDAVMKTCITYKYRDKHERILIINYMPDHPQAHSYYPTSLRELLRKVSEIRPRTKYEKSMD